MDKRSYRRQFGEIFDFPFILCYMTKPKARQGHQVSAELRARPFNFTSLVYPNHTDLIYFTKNSFSRANLKALLLRRKRLQVEVPCIDC